MNKVNMEVITPEMAKAMLANLSANVRNLMPSHVAALRKIIERGNWNPHAAMIQLNKDGSVVNGQHRLAAIVASGISVSCLVQRGVESIIGIDTSIRGQTEAQKIAKSYGIGSASRKGAVARFILAYERKMWSRASLSNADISQSEIADFLIEHIDEIEAAYSLTASCNKVTPLFNASELAAILFIAGQLCSIKNAVATSFVSGLKDGESLKIGNPVLTLRQYLITNNLKHKMHLMKRRFVITHAWNAYAEGRTLKRIANFDQVGVIEVVTAERLARNPYP